MGCYDRFNFEKDFSFQNHKGDFVIIPRGEYQTKDLKSLLDTLVINENFEIQRPIWQSIETNIVGYDIISKENLLSSENLVSNANKTLSENQEKLNQLISR